MDCVTISGIERLNGRFERTVSKAGFKDWSKGKIITKNMKPGLHFLPLETQSDADADADSEIVYENSCLTI